MKQFLGYSFSLMILISWQSAYAQRVVNVYVWGGEIPRKLIHQFEKESGIHVNFSTYDNNETMYAKLKATRKPIYDVIMPSGYFVERMRKQGMLEPLNHEKLPNLKYLQPIFSKSAYDPNNKYSVPMIWGVTGIFYNTQRVKDIPVNWSDLWKKHWRNELLLLDDAREVFSIALMRLGYAPNDENPQHIEEAYQQLLQLIPNIKLFASESVQAILIDEDAIAGSVWNGDAYKAHNENSAITFVYPQEGFVIWTDCLALLKGLAHPKESYAFINYFLRPEVAATIALTEGHAITNQGAKQLLPKSVQMNPLLYPDAKILQRGFVQRDVSTETINLYNAYWEKFKLSF